MASKRDVQANNSHLARCENLRAHRAGTRFKPTGQYADVLRLEGHLAYTALAARIVSQLTDLANSCLHQTTSQVGNLFVRCDQYLQIIGREDSSLGDVVHCDVKTLCERIFIPGGIR